MIRVYEALFASLLTKAILVPIDLTRIMAPSHASYAIASIINRVVTRK